MSLGGMSAAGGGSGNCCPPRCKALQPFGPSAAAPRSSALLFDRHPGTWPTAAFAQRSDWPSTDSYYSPGEVIYYNDRFIDYQGRNFSPDYSYRRFDTSRSGIGFR
jgi:hypothetical protein